MTDNIVAILFLLTGAVLAALVWLFVDMNKANHGLKEFETERRLGNAEHQDIWIAINRCEENIAKINFRLDEKSEANGNDGV